MKPDYFIKFILLYFFITKISFLVIPTLIVGPVDWLEPIYVSFLYILISSFLLASYEPLDDYHINTFSIILLILFGTIFRFDIVNNNDLGILLKGINWVFAGLLLLKFIRHEFVLPSSGKNTFTWAAIGLGTGLCLSIPFAYLAVHKPDFNIGQINRTQYASLMFIMKTLAYIGSGTAIPEEFVFRGLLWGYLTKIKYPDKQAFAIQAIVTWLFHFDRIVSSPIAFWIIVPVGTLAFSLLVWRSRSLASSIMAHMVLDTFQIVFEALFAS
jgi:membrane protease YdiL (CAAX protease family)